MATNVLQCFCVVAVIQLTIATDVPPEWVLSKRADPNELVHVTLALKQTNRDWLERTLLSVSDPDSPNYGHHMSLEEIAKYVHAYSEGVAKVKEVLRAVGVLPNFTIGEGFAIADIPVSVAENLFSATFYNFQHRDKPDMTTIRTLEYTIPSSLQPHLDFMCCINKFPYPDQVKTHFSYERPKSLGVSPISISKNYNISDYQSSNENNSQAIASFLKEYFDPSDLTDFQDEFGIPSNPIAKVIGTNKPNSPGSEASLDVEYITAVGKKVRTWFISVSTYSNGKQEDFLSWLTFLANTSDSPWVHSVSYGDVESTIDQSYLQRCDDEFKKLGISGRTILFGSGDDGVDCKSGKFRPGWPTSSPYITSVGGTESMTRVWPYGGGGFSNVFRTPDYQMQTVKNYLNSGKAPNTSYFNPQGRAYPDVSAFAVGFLIYVGGEVAVVGGTSCSTPTVAGIISLLNDVRLNKGMSTLGFFNPLLYKLQGQGFSDITKGENYGDNVLCGGFKAIKGWDPASGWGSPNFGVLKDLVIQ